MLTTIQQLAKEIATFSPARQLFLQKVVDEYRIQWNWAEDCLFQIARFGYLQEDPPLAVTNIGGSHPTRADIDLTTSEQFSRRAVVYVRVEMALEKMLQQATLLDCCQNLWITHHEQKTTTHSRSQNQVRIRNSQTPKV